MQALVIGLVIVVGVLVVAGYIIYTKVSKLPPLKTVLDTLDKVGDKLKDEIIGTEMICPDGGKLDLTLCKWGCPDGYTMDALGVRCYKNPPAGWKGSNDLATIMKQRVNSIGTVPNSCPAGMTKIGALCYPNCNAGFARKDTIGCYGVCPAPRGDAPAYDEKGLTCFRPSYLRTPYDSQSKCQSATGKNCQQRGAFWYQMWCRDGYDDMKGEIGCVGRCPDGWTGSDGICWKPMQQGSDKVTSVLVCPPGKENINGLCYDKCPAGLVRDAADIAVCREQCPAGWTDSGLFCNKPAVERKIKTILEVGVCPAGKKRVGALCYPE
jgi:hypothetical protein